MAAAETKTAAEGRRSPSPLLIRGDWAVFPLPGIRPRRCPLATVVPRGDLPRGGGGLWRHVLTTFYLPFSQCQGMVWGRFGDGLGPIFKFGMIPRWLGMIPTILGMIPNHPQIICNGN